jgi:hypothetical protein
LKSSYGQASVTRHIIIADPVNLFSPPSPTSASTMSSSKGETGPSGLPVPPPLKKEARLVAGTLMKPRTAGWLFRASGNQAPLMAPRPLTFSIASLPPFTFHSWKFGTFCRVMKSDAIVFVPGAVLRPSRPPFEDPLQPPSGWRLTPLAARLQSVGYVFPARPSASFKGCAVRQAAPCVSKVLFWPLAVGRSVDLLSTAQVAIKK